jgi:hypothetical protein
VIPPVSTVSSRVACTAATPTGGRSQSACRFISQLILGDGRLGSRRSLPRNFIQMNHAGPAVNNTRADQPGSMGAFRGTQANQRAIQNDADLLKGLQSFGVVRPRLGDQSQGVSFVSHASIGSERRSSWVTKSVLRRAR